VSSGDFVIWRNRPEPDVCVLAELRGIDDPYRLNDGTPLACSFPSGVTFTMDPDHADDDKLGDSLLNTDMVLVVSDRLDRFLREHAGPFVEHLPVGIVDHRGRQLGDPYFVAHPIEPVDCFDRAQSIFEPSLINSEDIDQVEKLVVDQSRIPSGRVLFRMTGLWDVTLVHRDLADAIERAAYTGVEFIEIDEFPE
jgi:hypothetical protein